MIGNIDPTVLAALIGAPAAFLIAIGTVVLVRKPRSTNGNGTNGTYKWVTRAEMRDSIDEIKDDMSRMKTDFNARLDLILRLLKLMDEK